MKFAISRHRHCRYKVVILPLGNVSADRRSTRHLTLLRLNAVLLEVLFPSFPSWFLGKVASVFTVNNPLVFTSVVNTE